MSAFLIITLILQFLLAPYHYLQRINMVNWNKNKTIAIDFFLLAINWFIMVIKKKAGDTNRIRFLLAKIKGIF